ncbi:MAG: hypothetical protein WD971_02805 [Pirellulales bacterium]
MKTFSNSLIAALVVGTLGLAGDALANGGGNGGKKNSGFSISFGGNGGGNGGGGSCNHNGNNNGNYNNNQSCHSNGGYNNYDNYNMNGGQGYEPFHSSYFCLPGDTFYEVSLKEYGSSVAMKYIAQYNRLATNSALVPGQRLLLPSISANRRLSASRAPAAEQFNTAPGQFPTAKFTLPTTTTPIAPAIATEPLPSVPTGSVLKLDGQSLGTEAGVVRLRISNVAFPVEVVEWAADSTKVRLPKLDVSGPTKADLEVVRADGTIASTNAIELTTAASSLATN